MKKNSKYTIVKTINNLLENQFTTINGNEYCFSFIYSHVSDHFRISIRNRETNLLASIEHISLERVEQAKSLLALINQVKQKLIKNVESM